MLKIKGIFFDVVAMVGIINNVEKRKYFLKSYLIVIGIYFSTNCLAEEWYIQPAFSLRTEYDDNKRLLSDSFVRRSLENGNDVDLSAYGIITTAQAKTGVRSEVFDVFFNSKVAVKKYFSDLDLDSEDFFLDLGSSYFLNERNAFGFSAKYNQESTLTAELDDTGLVQDNVPKTTWSVSPNWTHNISETKFIQAVYSHTDTSYEQLETSRFVDYTYDVVSLTFSHNWNSKLKNSLTAGWSNYKAPSTKTEQNQYSINGQIDYVFSETWTASLMGGVQFTKTEISGSPSESLGRVVVDGNRILLSDGRVISSNAVNLTNRSFDLIPGGGGILEFADASSLEQPDFSSNETAFVFSFNTEKQFEKGDIAASYTRSNSPTGFGGLRTLDKFSVDYHHRITKHLHFDLNGAIHITKATVNQNLNNDRTYYSVTPSLRWQFNRQLSLFGGYRYRRQEFERANTSSSADNTKSVGESNAVFITLKYQWDKFSTQEF